MNADTGLGAFSSLALLSLVFVALLNENARKPFVGYGRAVIGFNIFMFITPTGTCACCVVDAFDETTPLH